MERGYIMSEQLERVASALNGRGFMAEVFADASAAKCRLMELIGDRSVGIGGSSTVDGLGVYEDLLKKGNTVHWHWKEPDMNAARARASQAQVYVASSNALSEDGCLVNTDGHGNRVAGMFFGPPVVVLLIGCNKIVPDLEAALLRVKEKAAPLNAKRLNLDTPCGATGTCADCRSGARMCNVTSILEGRPGHVQEFRILLVDEELGF